MVLPFVNRFIRRGSPAEQSEIGFDRLVDRLSRIRSIGEQKALFDVVENAPLGVCVINEQRLIEYVNPAFCRSCGCAPEELIGRRFSAIVRVEGWDTPGRSPEAPWLPEQGQEAEVEILRKDGAHARVFASAIGVADERGRPRTIAYIRDATGSRHT